MATPSVFDLASAQRIAAAVRRVEIGDRSEAALRFRRIDPQQQRKVFRIATFEGAWAIGGTKTVEFKYQTSTPNTASVLNLFFPWPGADGTTDCAIAREGAAWHLIDVPMQTATAVLVSATASQVIVEDIDVQTAFVATTATASIVSGISVAAALDTANCNITVSTTQSTSAISYVSGGTSISTVTKTTATIAVIQVTYTASFLSFSVQ